MSKLEKNAAAVKVMEDLAASLPLTNNGNGSFTVKLDDVLKAIESTGVTADTIKQVDDARFNVAGAISLGLAKAAKEEFAANGNLEKVHVVAEFGKHKTVVNPEAIIHKTKTTVNPKTREETVKENELKIKYDASFPGGVVKAIQTNVKSLASRASN